MKKQFVVIGLGRFGSSVCKELYDQGHDVLAIDIVSERIDEIISFSTHAVIADATDEKALQSLGITNFEHVIVAIGDNIQSSILSTLILKEMGIEKVWVKAQSEYHHRVLEKIGADRIVRPEHDMGIRIAQQLTTEKVIDYIELSDDYSIVELIASEKLANKTLAGLNIRAKYQCTVLAIKRGEEMNISPLPSDKIMLNDILTVIGSNDHLQKFEDEGL